MLWKVHLLRRQPERLSTLTMVLFIGGGAVWRLFQSLLPALAAVGLLLGSAAEYLLPITYHIDATGISARSAVSDLKLKWPDARRCLPELSGIIVTSLPAASRLDRFRGVLLRYAPDGEPGDRSSVLAAIAAHAPGLAVPANDPVATVATASHHAPLTGGRP